MKNILNLILSASLLLTTNLTRAEDIDIYDSNTGTASNPNVLIILDNSANWSANNQGWPDDPAAPASCGNNCKSKQGYYELKALRDMLDALKAKFDPDGTVGSIPINIGLQMFNSSNAARKGTYMRSAIVPMTTANQLALKAKINTIISNFNTETSSSSVQYSTALWDAFKYFGGLTNPTNATSNATSNPSPNPTYSTIPVFDTRFWGSNDADGSNADPAAYNGNRFNPVSVDSCGRNYIVFIGNGFPGPENNSEDMGDVLSKLTNPSNPTAIPQFPLTTVNTTCTNVSSSLAAALGISSSNIGCVAPLICSLTQTVASLFNSNTTTYTCNQGSCGGSSVVLQACTKTTTFNAPSGNATNRYADEFTNFLNTTDVSSSAGQQNVVTYTIDVFRNAPSSDQTALMRNMASYGGGKYFAASDLSQITQAFDIILSEIQSQNSVFASSSLPVSVNTQGTYLNQVFIGMFKPDTFSQPRWYGNLKQYQFKFFEDNSLRMVDFSSPSINAVSATTGFITPCATSAWTSDSGNYWQFNANSAGLCTAATKNSDAPDGAVVEKGGAAQRLRGTTANGISTNYATRALKSCSDCTSLTGLTDFNTSNSTLTASALSVTPGNEAAMINWIRGQDVDNENNTATASNSVTNEVRPSVHGGVVHSEPAVVDYGGTTGVVSFYGADDGVFHAVNGNKTGTEAGNELWGFIAPEHYSKFNRLRQNAPIIKFPTVSSSITPTPLPKDYFFDGSTAIFQRAPTVWIYTTMRRGGRAIYAFDVTNPSSPALKWRRGCYTNSTANDVATNAKCDTNWTTIGQTWSKPQIAYLSGYVDASNKPKPVLVFGGGYDTCEDTDSQVRCTTTPRKGANVWFVDADTGNIIRTYATNYSVPGEIKLLTNSTGYLTYAYAADTGGYLYRINVGTYDGATFSSTWTNNSAASNITIANLSETNQARKFLFGPDVIVYRGYNGVAIGSGDREHPLINSYACNNFASSGVKNQFYIIKDRPGVYPATPITPNDLTDVTTNFAATTSTINNNGLRFDLVDPANPTSRCEQTVNKSLTIAGVTYFGTNRPKRSSELTSCGVNLGLARGYGVSFLTGRPVDNNSRSVIFTAGGLPPSPVAGIVDIDGNKTPFCIGCAGIDRANADAQSTTVTSDSTSASTQNTASTIAPDPLNIDPLGPRQRLYWYLDAD